jgi:hypothetical protein
MNILATCLICHVAIIHVANYTRVLIHVAMWTRVINTRCDMVT